VADWDDDDPVAFDFAPESQPVDAAILARFTVTQPMI